MSSSAELSGRCPSLAGLPLMVACCLGVPSLAGQHPAPGSPASGGLAPRLAQRVTAAVAASWGVDTASLVLSWGSGALSGLPDSSAFRLLGGGEGGWFAVNFEPPGRPPLAVRLRAGITRSRLVAARALRPGMRLSEPDLRPESHIAWGPPALAEEPVPTVGWVVRRPTTPGMPLDRSRVGPPPAIAAGQPVRVQWAVGSVSVTLEGTALNDAVVGETVRVRTGGRTGVLRGTVTAPGEARMK